MARNEQPVATSRRSALGVHEPSSSLPARRRAWSAPRFDDRGAAMVEFALILPVFAVLLFGIFEFGFVFGQHLDVRHGAREGARLAAVNHNPAEVTGAAQSETIVQATCAQMDLASGATVSWRSVPGSAGGSYISVTVSAEADQVTGIFFPVLDGLQLRSAVEIRIEGPRTFAVPYSGVCP